MTFQVTDCQYHDHRRIFSLKLLNARRHMFQKLSCYKGFSSFVLDVPSTDLMMVRSQIAGTN